jgi:hypothetical protein
LLLKSYCHGITSFSLIQSTFILWFKIRLCVICSLHRSRRKFYSHFITLVCSPKYSHSRHVLFSFEIRSFSDSKFVYAWSVVLIPLA